MLKAQHRAFPRGPPPQYYPGSNLLLTSLFGWEAVVSQADMAALKSQTSARALWYAIPSWEPPPLPFWRSFGGVPKSVAPPYLGPPVPTIRPWICTPPRPAQRRACRALSMGWV
jgi:hypothetical protein